MGISDEFISDFWRNWHDLKIGTVIGTISKNVWEYVKDHKVETIAGTGLTTGVVTLAKQNARLKKEKEKQSLEQRTEKIAIAQALCKEDARITQIDNSENRVTEVNLINDGLVKVIKDLELKNEALEQRVTELLSKS